MCIDDVYGGTQRLFRRVATPAANLSFTFLDLSDPKVVIPAITPKTKVIFLCCRFFLYSYLFPDQLIWVESPTNPTLKITDIQAVADALKQTGRTDIWFVVDNTFMSPYLQVKFTLM